MTDQTDRDHRGHALYLVMRTADNTIKAEWRDRWVDVNAVERDNWCSWAEEYEARAGETADYRAAVSELGIAYRTADRLADTARALVTRLDEIFGHPSYEGLIVLAHVHGMPYNGPSCEAELTAMRLLLAGPTEPTKEAP